MKCVLFIGLSIYKDLLMSLVYIDLSLIAVANFNCPSDYINPTLM
jgi:hypothetical protein